MGRIIFWLTRRFKGSGRFCHHFCPMCEYYGICKGDGIGIDKDLLDKFSA